MARCSPPGPAASAVRYDIGADAASLGLALGGTAIGALTAMSITGVVCCYRSPFRVACVTLLCLCLSMVLPGLSRSPLSLGLALLVFGACYGATDVAMNSAAVQLAAASAGRSCRSFIRLTAWER